MISFIFSVSVLIRNLLIKHYNFIKQMFLHFMYHQCSNWPQDDQETQFGGAFSSQEIMSVPYIGGPTLVLAQIQCGECICCLMKRPWNRDLAMSLTG